MGDVLLKFSRDYILWFQVYQKVYKEKTEKVCNTRYERKCEKKVGENCYIVPDQK